MKSSIIRELLKFTQQPDLISFAGGLPAPEFFPVEQVDAATSRILAEHGEAALQYGLTEGYRPLRELIVRHMERYGIVCDIDNVLITSGSQQALDLIGRVLIDRGDNIVVEEPTYLGALQAWNVYGANYITVPTDDNGMRMDALDDILCHMPVKFIYALPNFQNPGGFTMSAERRQQLVEMADSCNVPIVEDDPYGQLRYEGEHLTPLIVSDANNCAARGENGKEFISGNTLYLSTFSKTLAPGLRVAWVVGPREIIGRLVQAKQGADLHTSTFGQMVAYETARGGFLDEHVAKLRRVYAERRDLMLKTLKETFPPGVHWTHPEGGLFLWATLPEGADTVKLLEKAIAAKVAFVPGTAFHPNGGGDNTMRLNFSNSTPEQIVEGITRLAEVIAEEIGVETMGVP